MASVLANYLNIVDIAAGPNSTWYANASTNGGNNTGWTFGDIVRVQNLNIVDSSVSGPTIWLALYTDGNINGGNNSGWIFTSNVNSGAFLFYFP